MQSEAQLVRVPPPIPGKSEGGLVNKVAARFKAPVLTPQRIAFAYAVAVITDGIQLGLLSFGWVFIDEALDVIAMILTTAALGFHPLLLPTFILELVPVVDWLPTWTGCTTAVVLLRKRSQSKPPPPVVEAQKPIDI